MQTSQATDLISGGVKINALSEDVYAVINHRIAVESRIADICEHLVTVISEKILTKFSLSVDARGSMTGNTSASSTGKLRWMISTSCSGPHPSHDLISKHIERSPGTIKQVMGEDIIDAPSLTKGSTDSKFYWNLSKNIYTFSPVRDEGKANGHTVDERIGMQEHVEGVRLYAQLVMNGDRA